MNVVGQRGFVNSVLETIRTSLAQNGLVLYYAKPILRGNTQHRYEVRRRSGEFIAWFCWYSVPDRVRVPSTDGHTEIVRHQICTAHIDYSDERALVERLLIALERIHPASYVARSVK